MANNKRNSFSGSITLLKSKCAEPCGGGAGGGGTPPIDYQPQIDKINDHLNQNDAKLTTHDVELANLNKTVTDNKNDVDLQINQLSSMTTDSINELKQKDTQIEQDIRNINNDLNNNYVLKTELADEVKTLNDKIDNLNVGGGGVDYQPQIDALKEKDKQLDQRIVDNSGKIQANENEINNIKTDYATKINLGDAVAKCLQDSNDYTDEKIKQVKTDVDTNRNLITNLDGRVQTLENNQGTGGGTGNLSESFIFISVSIQDGKVLCAAYNPDNHQQISGIDWNIQYKTAHFRKGVFIEPGATQVAKSSTYSFDQYTDAITYTNARISAEWNGKQYIAGLKQTLMNTGDVDYVAGANLRLIALRS